MLPVMRSGAGPGARLGALALPAVPAVAAVAALLLGAGSRAAVVSSSASASGSTGPSGVTGASTPASPNKRAGALYRIVGCRSQGAAAYLHGPRRREAAVGFDDGPARDTPAFVRMLERSGARATFFMIGEQVNAAYTTTMLRELRDGDVLGDHTFTHPRLTTSGNVRGQLQKTISVIRALTGYTPCVFRPPYGAYDASVTHIARSLGLATVMWNVDPSDYTQPGTGAIERRVLAQVQPGSIIISHDGGGPRGQTLAAYPTIFAKLRARGYRIVTIPELLGFRPVFVPCIRLCDGIGTARSALPANAILQRAP